jgi:hypothetical protein
MEQTTLAFARSCTKFFSGCPEAAGSSGGLI